MFNNLEGKVFGKLKVIEMAPRTQKKTFWVCTCECGKTHTIRSDSLTSGKTTSCGCAKKDQDRINLIMAHRHKKSGTRLYTIRNGIISRCHNQNVVCFERYGGRGIKVCDDWRNSPESFMDWALSNGYNDDLSIERIDSNGNYEPSNCKWATVKEQSNNRRSTVKITINGETKSMKTWCHDLGLNYGTVNSRYNRGVSMERLFSEKDLRTN